MKSFTKQNIVEVLTQIQDEGDFNANVIATQAIKDFGLEKEHAELQEKIRVNKIFGCNECIGWKV